MPTTPPHRSRRESVDARVRSGVPALSAAALPGPADVAVSVHALRTVAARLEELAGRRAG